MDTDTLASSGSESTVQKLGHDIPEIRARALRSVHSKLSKYLSGHVKEHSCNLTLLVKSLLKWFSFKPLMEEDRAIHLLHDILKSQGGIEVIQNIGAKSLLKDINKIQQSVAFASASKDKLEEIVQLVAERKPLKDISNSNLELVQGSVTSIVSDASESEVQFHSRFTYEVPWQSPVPADRKSMRLLSAALRCATDLANVQHGLQFLKTACDDLPGEYFLQPPYIAMNLQSLITHRGPYSHALIRQCKHLVRCLHKRILQRQMIQTKMPSENLVELGAKSTQITVTSFVQEMFECTLNHLKVLVDERQLDELNSTYELLLELVEVLAENAHKTPDVMFPFEENISEIGYLVRYFRQAWEASGIDCPFERHIYVRLLLVMLRLIDVDLMYTENSRSEGMNLVKQVVVDELRMAMFDFPLQHFFEDLWSSVLPYFHDDNYSTILDCAALLRPMINELREPPIDIDDPLLTNALQAVDMLSLHQSVPLSKRIFERILGLVPQFDNNIGLRVNSELIMLRLLSTDHQDTKRLIYGLSADRMKFFFGSLMEGSAIPSRRSGGNTHTKQWMGIPLTTDILIEVICFGAFSSDSQIQSSATTMITLLLRSKTMLPAPVWSEVMQILIPTMPLLQCLSSKSNVLGSEVLALFNPDNTTVTFLDQLHGNIRLFFRDSVGVRDEALARLLYIIASRPGTERFMPNITNITDVISSDLCLTEHPWNPDSSVSIAPIHDPNTIASLIDLLSTPGGEPEVRRVTMLQLSIIASDPSACAIIERRNGLQEATKALRNALLEAHNSDYPDTTIPTVGLIAKLCVHSTDVRRELHADPEVVLLLVRSLLLFHKNDSFRRDCSIAIFLISFNDFSVGQTKISLPALIVSNFHVPFVCSTHWSESPFIPKLPLTELLDGADISSTEWQYVRFVVAREFFPETLFTKVQEMPLEYPALPFNVKLRLNQSDVRLLRSSDSIQYFDTSVKAMANATTHPDVLEALAALKSVTLLPINRLRFQDINQQECMDSFRRFLSISPNTESDQHVFEGLLGVVLNVVDVGLPQIHCWVLEQLRRPKCPLLTILRSNSASVRLVDESSRFIRLILHRAATSEDPKILALLNEKLGNSENMVVYFFEAVVSTLDEKFESREFDKLRSLLALLRTLTTPNHRQQSTFVCDEDAVNFVANKLMHFVVSIKSLTQTGSAFNRNCLRVVANLMHTIPAGQFTLNKKFVVLCSGLCGHAGVGVRLAAWAVLTELARSFEGSRHLVSVLSTLPGGFHACCLSTFLDVHESSAVRQSAGELFALLLSHNNASRSIEPNCVTPRTTPQPNDIKSTIRELIQCHQFIPVMADQLRYFWAENEDTDHSKEDEVYTDVNDSGRPIITCDIVRTYCSIVAHLLRLNPTDTMADLQSNGLLTEILHLIPTVLLAANESSIRMLIEVCKIVALGARNSDEFLDHIAQDEHAIIGAMVSSTQPKLYDSCSNDLRLDALIGLLTILTPLATRTDIISDNAVYGAKSIQILTELFEYAFKINQHEDLTRLSLNLLRNLLTYVPERSCRVTFSDQIDTVLAEDGSAEVLPSEQIFTLVNGLFKWSGKKKSSLRPTIAATVALLLKYTEGARATARAGNFFNDILNEFDAVHSRLDGVSCSEFLRRFGDSKKEPIITSLSLLFSILSHWFSQDCLVGDVAGTDPTKTGFDNTSIHRFCRLSMQTWPWTGADQRLQIVFMRSLAFACEDSVPMCKAMSTIRSASVSGTTVLQMCAEFAMAETARAKPPTSDLLLLELTMAIVSNCCACVEGRQFLGKMSFLDAMSRLHPSVTKHQKPWPRMTLIWLNFYEILSRYPDPNTGIKHLSLLCTFVLKPATKLGPDIRYQSISVIRNFAFNPLSRPALIASEELMYVFKMVIEKGTLAEQQLVVSAIWRLVANSYKAKHTFRCGTVMDALWSLASRLAQDEPHTDDVVTELASSLEMLRLVFEK